MPKPAVPVVDDDPVVVNDLEPVTTPEPVEEIDLNAKPPVEPTAEEKLAAKVKEDIGRLYAGKLAQVENRLKGSQRINTTLQQKISVLEQRVNQPIASLPPQRVPGQHPRAAELQAQVDAGQWIPAVGEVAEERAEVVAQRVLQRHLQEQQGQQVRAAQEQLVSRAVALVVQKYPDLDPDMGNSDSDVARAYAAVFNEDPSLYNSPYGPEIAMYRMEQALTSAQHGQVSAETARQQRLGQTGLAPARPVPSTGKVTIDREEKEFIDYHGIDPKVYAKMKQSLAQQGGVEV